MFQSSSNLSQCVTSRCPVGDRAQFSTVCSQCLSVSLSLSFLVSSPTTMKSAMNRDRHCELQEICFFDMSGYTHKTEVHV